MKGFRTCSICGVDLPSGIDQRYTLICTRCEQIDRHSSQKPKAVSEMIQDLNIQMTDSDIERELADIKTRFGSDIFERYDAEQTIKTSSK